MEDQDIEFSRKATLASFAGELAFARLLLAMLFAASLGGWLFTFDTHGLRGVQFAVAATFCAWFAQMMATQDRDAWFSAFRFAAVVFAGVSAWHLCLISYG